MLTDKELEEWSHQLCEFLSDGNDCDKCGKNPAEEPIYFYRTSVDTIEGDYICKPCAEKRIEGWKREIAELRKRTNPNGYVNPNPHLSNNHLYFYKISYSYRIQASKT